MQSLGCNPHTLLVQGHYSVPNFRQWFWKMIVMMNKSEISDGTEVNFGIEANDTD